MKKNFGISVVLATGFIICIFAPAVWTLVGVFCIGSGVLVMIAIMRSSQVDRLIEQYKQQPMEVQSSKRALTMPYLGRVTPRQNFIPHLNLGSGRPLVCSVQIHSDGFSRYCETCERLRATD